MRTLLALGIGTEIHFVLRHSGVPRHEGPHRQLNVTRDIHGRAVIQLKYRSASNRARQISQWRLAGKAKWETDKCSVHVSYQLKGKKGTKRPVTLTSVKLLATRFSWPRCWQAPTVVYLKLFGHREDGKCWCCGAGGRSPSQMQKYLVRLCSRRRDQQMTLWKMVGIATGWKAGWCSHVQSAKLFSITECDQAVMDFLTATDIGQFPPKWTSALDRSRGRLRGWDATMWGYSHSFCSFTCLSFCAV